MQLLCLKIGKRKPKTLMKFVSCGRCLSSRTPRKNYIIGLLENMKMGQAWEPMIYLHIFRWGSGQTVCTPLRPRCSLCTVNCLCPCWFRKPHAPPPHRRSLAPHPHRRSHA